MNLRDMARGQRCMIRLPMHCNHDKATTVLAHYRLAGYSGTGDWSFGAWSCSSCHDVIDGRVKTDHEQAVLRLMHAEGCMRTQAELRKLKANGEI